MKLDDLLAEFDGAAPEEALEMLIDFSHELPPLSPERAALNRPAECRVQECQTPVFLWVDIVDGRVRLEADVPEKSPTVRGLVALLVQGLTDATPAEVASLSGDILVRLGLADTLGMTRRNGVQGIIRRIQQRVAEAIAIARRSES